MTYRLHNDYYIPRTKAELLRSILPLWKGSRTDLREMSIKRLKGIFRSMRDRQWRELVKK